MCEIGDDWKGCNRDGVKGYVERYRQLKVTVKELPFQVKNELKHRVWWVIQRIL